MLKQVNKDLVDEDGVYVRYRLDGNLFNLSYAAFKLTPRLMRSLFETFSSQMMLPWLVKENEPCNVSLPASQMLPSFLASRSASRRRRFSTSLPPGKNTIHLTSLSAKPSWSQCSSSLTRVVPSHLMPGSTRKSTIGYPKQAVPSTDYIKGSGTTRIWRPKPRSVYTGS